MAPGKLRKDRSEKDLGHTDMPGDNIVCSPVKSMSQWLPWVLRDSTDASWGTFCRTGLYKKKSRGLCEQGAIKRKCHLTGLVHLDRGRVWKEAHTCSSREKGLKNTPVTIISSYGYTTLQMLHNH